ncbi:MAG: OsmC family protein [Proteobacteria bacterium]|nr:OsmC family protein [Pseudomonadota bacterium]
MGKPAPFPHHYEVALEGRQLLAPPRAPIAVGAPPQFGGGDTVWSPEDLLVGATLECLWTTFEAYARHDDLAFADWRGAGVGVLDKGPTGPVFTSITLSVGMEVAAVDVERAQRVLATAEQHCIISNALRVAVTLIPTIRARAAS